MIKKMIRSTAGFTLVEMLVVVAIIAILASVFLVGLSGFRRSAYDARRLSDLQKVQTYLEMYYNKNQAYPTALTDLSSVGISDVPSDPVGGSYQYGADTSRQSYVLGAQISTDSSVYNSSSTLVSGCTQVDGLSCGKTCTPPLYCVQF